MPGLDYSDTFAPVAKRKTFRIIIAFAVRHGLKLSSLDVWVAFLNGDITEEIYMDQPEGHVDQENPTKK